MPLPILGTGYCILHPTYFDSHSALFSM